MLRSYSGPGRYLNPQVCHYLYPGNAFVTAVAAAIMTVPVLPLNALLQRFIRETSLAGVVR